MHRLFAWILFTASWSTCLHSGTDARKRFLVPDAHWSSWSIWSQCSVSCGSGRQLRIRQCIAPSNGGLNCLGSSLEITDCSSPCSMDGKWNNWSEWSECSTSCGSGRRLRIRHCNNPLPSNGGGDCLGSPLETESCVSYCPVEYHVCDKVRLFNSIFLNNSVSQNGDMSCPDSRYHYSRALLGTLCKAPSTTLLFGSKVIEVCSQIPSFVAVGKVDSLSGLRDYGILVECHGHIKVALQDCHSNPHLISLDEKESSAYYTLHW